MEDKLKVWLARDKSGSIFAFSERPNKEKDIWTLESSYVCIELSFRKFPSIKWEDDEPTEAYIALAEPQEQSQPKIDWEQRRYEIAKEMMPVLYRQGVEVLKYGQSFEWKEIVDGAVNFADMLIEKLKEQSE